MTPAALAAIHAACFTVPRPWSAAELADLIASPSTLLAEATDGFALARVAADEAELLTIAVRPEARGRGLGSALLRDVLAAAAARGAGRMVLEVAADNAAALALYRREGFAECGRRKGYYAAPDGRRIDALIMARAEGGTAR
ncbi:MAG: ribosomal protein S18-alanine N-acetyltransferase [Pseudomonadota bacterium]